MCIMCRHVKNVFTSLKFDFAVHDGCRLATSRSTDLPDSIKKSLVSIGGTVSKVACAWRHQLIEVRSRMLNPTKTTRAPSAYARALSMHVKSFRMLSARTMVRHLLPNGYQHCDRYQKLSLLRGLECCQEELRMKALHHRPPHERDCYI